jgi:hypothetical protein
MRPWAHPVTHENPESFAFRFTQQETGNPKPETLFSKQVLAILSISSAEWPAGRCTGDWVDGREDEMIVIRTCWYLCAMFLAALGCSSLISVAPGGKTIIAAFMGTSIILAAGSGLLAIFLKRQFRKKPDSFIFRSMVVSGVGVGAAAILTLIFLVGVIG